MNIKKCLKNNKILLLGIIFSSILLFNVSIFFSSVRNYLIKNVKKEIGDYHVIIKGDIKDNNVILKKQEKSGRIFITFKNIYRVYINTKKICDRKCESITYNDKLLSLYGMSKKENIMNTMLKVLVFIIMSLSIILFFIIYNSFKVRLIKQKKEICLYKLAGCTNWDISKNCLKETIILFIVGILVGFVISLINNIILTLIIGSMLKEIFDNLIVSVNIPFTIISILFIFTITFSSAIIPLKIIKKYKPMELFRKNYDIDVDDIKLKENIPLWLAETNYIRQSKKYKGLTLSIFISCLFINLFLLFLNYGLRCIKEYVIIPKYDLAVVSEKYDLNKIVKDLKPKKKQLYKSCNKEIKISKKYYKNNYQNKENFLITNLGKNEIVNIKNEIVEDNNKIKKEETKIFNNLNNINLENENINITLTDKIPYGFYDNKIVLNLEKETFKKVCKKSNNNLFLETDYKGIDKYMNKLIKKEKQPINYTNIKKEREIITNLIIIIKSLLYIVSVLIIIVTITVVISITSVSIEYRKKEINILKSIGLEKAKIIYSLLIESILISFKGWIYSLPFIFIVNKYMIISINEVFYNQKIIINIKELIISLIIIVTIVFITMYLNIRKYKNTDIVDSIKER